MSVLTHRLHNQLITHHPYNDPAMIVSHMLCMQAQDLAQSLRSLASRFTDTDCLPSIYQAYNDAVIVRTWTQRGTIHTVHAQDVWWITTLCASKTLPWFARRRQLLGISDEFIHSVIDQICIYLSWGPQSRAHIFAYLQDHHIILWPNRWYHILCYMGTLWLIVQGPIIAGEHWFVLRDWWVSSDLYFWSMQEAIVHLCLRYMMSHGPATLEDLAWRSGLSKTVLKRGIWDCDTLLSYDQHSQTYCTIDSLHQTHTTLPQAIRLAWFDERLLWYKDRSATLDIDHYRHVDASRNGVFKPTIMIDGKTVATWSVKVLTKKIIVTIKTFVTLSQTQQDLIIQAWNSYMQYRSKVLELIRI